MILLVGLSLIAVGCSCSRDESDTQIGELYEQGRFSDALEKAELLIAREPTRSLGYYWRGRTREATGDDLAALADYESATRHFDSANASYAVPIDEIDDAIIFVLMKLERFADAIERIESRLSTHPSDLSKHYDMSLACMALRDFDKAEATLRQFSEFAIDGAQWRSDLALGCIVALGGDWPEARARAKSAMEDCKVFRECDGFVEECAQAITAGDADTAIHALELHIGWTFPWRTADVASGD